MASPLACLPNGKKPVSTYGTAPSKSLRRSDCSPCDEHKSDTGTSDLYSDDESQKEAWLSSPSSAAPCQDLSEDVPSSMVGNESPKHSFSHLFRPHGLPLETITERSSYATLARPPTQAESALMRLLGRKTPSVSITNLTADQIAERRRLSRSLDEPSSGSSYHSIPRALDTIAESQDPSRSLRAQKTDSPKHETRNTAGSSFRRVFDRARPRGTLVDQQECKLASQASKYELQTRDGEYDGNSIRSGISSRLNSLLASFPVLGSTSFVADRTSPGQLKSSQASGSSFTLRSPVLRVQNRTSPTPSRSSISLAAGGGLYGGASGGTRQVRPPEDGTPDDPFYVTPQDDVLALPNIFAPSPLRIKKHAVTHHLFPPEYELNTSASVDSLPSLESHSKGATIDARDGEPSRSARFFDRCKRITLCSRERREDTPVVPCRRVQQRSIID